MAWWPGISEFDYQFLYFSSVYGGILSLSHFSNSCRYGDNSLYTIWGLSKPQPVALLYHPPISLDDVMSPSIGPAGRTVFTSRLSLMLPYCFDVGVGGVDVLAWMERCCLSVNSEAALLSFSNWKPGCKISFRPRGLGMCIYGREVRSAWWGWGLGQLDSWG